MRFEPGIYLEALMRDVVAFGGTFVIRRFDSPRDLVALPETIIANCSGLGAARLLSDEGMVPIKGQLVILVPQSEVTWSSGGMLPRSDGIVLGHMNQRGVDSLEVDEAERQRVLDSAIRSFSTMRRPPVGWSPAPLLAESRLLPEVDSHFDLRS